MSAETPEYEVLAQEGSFELRRYAGYLTANVLLNAAGYEQAMNGGFGPLAEYIFGANHVSDRISMTVPVTAGRVCCQKIPMTVPVTAQKSEAQYVVSFTMPSGYSIDDIPQPNNADVTIEQVSPHLAAVARFSGHLSESKAAEAVIELESWIARQNLTVLGEPIAAQYDAPWKPGFARRNEMMIVVEQP